MDQTVRDFIFECQNYEYSKEYFDLTKSLYELRLGEMYAESIEFLKESVEGEFGNITQLSESFIMEASVANAGDTDGKFRALKDSLDTENDKKKQNIFKKFAAAVGRLVRKIKNFFTRILAKITSLKFDDEAEIMKLVNSTTFSVMDAKQLADFIRTRDGDNELKNSIVSSLKFQNRKGKYKNITPQFAKDVDKDTQAYAKFALAIAFGETVYVHSTTDSPKLNYTAITAFYDLCKAATQTKTQAAVTAARKNFKTNLNLGESLIGVSLNETDLNNVIQTLEAAGKTADEMQQRLQAVNSSAEILMGLNEDLAQFNKLIGHTMPIYTKFAEIRQGVRGVIRTMLNNYGVTGKRKNSDSKTFQ